MRWQENLRKRKISKKIKSRIKVANQKSAKNKQISIKTSPKASNPQVFKKTCSSTKKQAQICGKTARFCNIQVKLFKTIPREHWLI